MAAKAVPAAAKAARAVVLAIGAVPAVMGYHRGSRSSRSRSLPRGPRTCQRLPHLGWIRQARHKSRRRQSRMASK